MAQLRISDLEKSNTGPVWVTNTTKGAERSIIVLAVPKANGPGVDSVKVPVTFLPVDLTGQVPKRQLLASSDFRRAVTSGYLKLVEADEAEKTLEQPGAQNELRRIQDEDRSVASASARLTAGTDAPEAVSSNLSPRVQQFLVTIEEASSASTILNTLRSMGELTEEEYRAVGKSAEAKKGFDSVISYCDDQIENVR